MIALTDNAVEAIRSITDQQQAPEGAGLRIASSPAEDQLMLSLTTGPQEGDQVLDEAGARLFLDAKAAEMLDEKALDAEMDSQGGIRFQVADT